MSPVAAESHTGIRSWEFAVAGTADSVFQATGTRVGEITDTSAIVWSRLTSVAERNNDGLVIKQRNATVDVPVAQLEGACPGAAGYVRLRYAPSKEMNGEEFPASAVMTGFEQVSPDGDFIHQFRLSGLKPDTKYIYESLGHSPADGDAHIADDPNGEPHRFRGTFHTAPAADAPSELTFTVMTCQGYADRGHPDGHAIYPSMQALDPKFACLTGDLVYYDSNPPRAVTQRLARYQWERMFSLPRLVEFNRHVATYWLKDDHDTLKDDSWPGSRMGEFTFEQGQEIFRQQAPISDGPAYRTFRWGSDLQIWLTDGRDHRSPNRMEDGPGKTIWGAEQKEWFKQTVSQSDALWKVLVTPTALVGPDRPAKNDNHSNAGFTHEGDEIRGWLQANVPDQFFSICGDRHWQFHSVHPQSGVHEFSVGPASDEHSGGSPGLNEDYHKFHRVKGGFLSVNLKRRGGESVITFRLHDVDGEAVYEYERSRPVG